MSKSSDGQTRGGARPAWASAAIVGRPNVGKSTLFNAIVGQQVAITDAMAGTTRDRLIHAVVRDGRRFDLIDTGGMGVIDVPELAGRIEEQIALAIEEAAVLIFLGDAVDGLTSADRRIAGLLRRSGKPVIMAVNKADAAGRDSAAAEFSALGFGEALPVSALHRRNMDYLLDQLLAVLPEAPPPPVGEFTIALVGRRNVGKSTFVNALAGCERVVTDQRPGTTRDSIDVVVGRDGQFFTVVDTAGMRRRGRPENAPEYKSLLRSERALERADAVALMLDSMQGVGSIDKRLGALAAASGKPVVIAVNKWDLTADEDTTGEYEEYLSEHLPGLAFAPVVFLSALEHQRVWAVPKLLRELWQLAGRHFRTALLNRAVRRVLAEQPPPTSKGRLPRIRFAVHTGIRPQRFSVRTVNAAFLHQSYRRFFDNRLRRELGLEELPVIIKFEEKR